MIYELRTTRVRPGTQPEYLKLLEAALPARQRHSKLAGCWYTEIGPLLQIVELWPYDSEEQREEVGQAVGRDGGWPPASGMVQSSEVEILRPAPFMEPLDGTPRKAGPFYELRTYQIQTGEIPSMIERWAAKLPDRLPLSPLLGAWHTEAGRWFHMWPYSDLAERTRVRGEALRTGAWPAPGPNVLVTQENKIMLPAAFSPLQ